MRIEGLEKYQRRNQNGHFEGLSPHLVPCANAGLTDSSGGDVPAESLRSAWLFAAYRGEQSNFPPGPGPWAIWTS